jgi:hypothetical protein
MSSTQSPTKSAKGQPISQSVTCMIHTACLLCCGDSFLVNCFFQFNVSSEADLPNFAWSLRLSGHKVRENIAGGTLNGPMEAAKIGNWRNYWILRS